MKITFSKKILGGFIICSLILLVVASVSFKNSESLVNTNAWVIHTHEVLYELEEIMINSIDAETAERGFIITGNEEYLAPFNDLTSKLFNNMTRVKELTKDNPVQQKNISAIKVLTDSLVKRLAFCIESRKTEGFLKAEELVASGIAKRLQDSIRKIIDNAKQTEETLLSQRKLASDRDARNFNNIFIVLLLIIGLVLLFVYNIIISNLKTLKKAQDETADKNWSLAGNGELVKNMEGNKLVQELAEAIINHLTAYLGAQMGAMYVTTSDGMNLQLAGSYALDKKQNDFYFTRFGEGIAGQAASEKRSIFVSDIPERYFNIQTGFGELLPKNIMAFPIIFESRVAGVIEIGTIRDFTRLEKDFMSMAIDNIAIALTSAQAREKTKQLLEETQRQAEELQAQQEELKQINEELDSKTQLLEKSEASLKVQQEELQQTNEELEEKANLLEEQKEKLEVAKTEVENKAEELELSSKYKSEFLANMSHELRTPLNSILILSQLLKDNKNKILGEKEVEYAGNIHSSGTDLLDLINEILDLSKVEAGKIELDIDSLYVSSVADTLQSVFNEIANTKSVNFHISYPRQKFSKPLYTDKQRLEQILKNLLSNAFKFTDSGGTVAVDIDIESPDHLPDNSRLKKLDKVVTFAVTDTGIGIAADKQEIIFQAFQQADGSTKRKYGGTGLGLSISEKLARVLGGEIQLQSKEGKGSRFTLTLPVNFHSVPTVVATEPEAKKISGKNIVNAERGAAIGEMHENVIDDRHTIKENDRIILIIEDDENFAKILLEFFRQKSYKGVIALQGNTGLSLARHYRPDAIILDMQLPVMDGAEVLKHLKNDPALRHIPVQIFSGYDRRKESLELGAFDFIKKPVTITEIQEAFECIEEFLRKKIKKLLIVEDNRQQNKAIRELIGNGDVKSLSAYTGTEAYEMIQKERVDCIIIDLGLPDMSGIGLMEKIKANNDLNKIPIIVYTGKDLTREEAARLNRLADTVVLKTANSKERLLDETTLFLHRIESRLPKDKQQIIRRLHRSDEVLRNRKVLIVDDDMRNIYSLSNALEQEGLNCVTAENGKEALATLKEQRDTDIILMDVMMPEMDGYEATHEIRKIAEFQKLPVIALTAKAMKGDREKCLEAGMSDYISKPVDIDQLLSLMRVWLYR